MRGTLWKKVTFGGTVNTVQEQGWVSNTWQDLTLRYGDVNEDNVINSGTGPGTDSKYLEDRVGGKVSMTTTGADSIYRYDYPCDINRDGQIQQSTDFDVWDTLLKPLVASGDITGAVVP
jgi:hypothetical protein